MLTTAYCLVVGLGLRLGSGLGLDFVSGGLVGYTHVFVLLSAATDCHTAAVQVAFYKFTSCTNDRR